MTKTEQLMLRKKPTNNIEMNDIKEGYSNKLKGKLFGLLCEREKDGQWERFLDSIILLFVIFFQL